MPRGKQAQKAPTKDTTNKQTSSQENPKENAQNDNTVNGEELTMTQLKGMINNLAAEMFDKKKKELKEELKEEMEEEMEYRLISQFGELEEMIDDAKEEVQKSVNKVKSQVEKLNKDIQRVQSTGSASQNETINQGLKSAVEELENLKLESRRLKRRVEKIEFTTCSKIPKDIRGLATKFDAFEQQQFDKNVQIVNLPESGDQDDDKHKILKIARDTFGMNLKITDIENSYRMGKKREDNAKVRDIIVKFKKKTTRDKFYENRKLAMTNEDPRHNIYVNDHLTQNWQHLLYVARKLYKAKKIQAAWSQGGNILIRKIENGPVIQIHSHEDLAGLQQTEDDQLRIHIDSDLDLSSDND